MCIAEKLNNVIITTNNIIINSETSKNQETLHPATSKFNNLTVLRKQ